MMKNLLKKVKISDQKTRKEIRNVWESKVFYLTHNTFASFCKERYGICRSYAYRILSGPIKRKAYISPRLRWKIWERDNFTCQMCGVRRHLSIHHIKPESKGGTLAQSNLTTLCRTCNQKVYVTELSFPIWPDVVVTTG